MNEPNTVLICAIVNFLKKQLKCGSLNDDGVEGVAIGIQCLEAAYEISDELSEECPYDLAEIFDKHLNKKDTKLDYVTNEKKTVAEILKNEGNSYMNCNDFRGAISCYTKAIEIDPKNPIYYCNRAAALNGFENYDSAIQDCQTALRYNPLYHKAYARMGIAYKAKNQLKEARDSFQKALQLQPENENYKIQLNNIEKDLRDCDNMINIEINGNRIPLSLQNIENDLAQVLNMATNMFSCSSPI